MIDRKIEINDIVELFQLRTRKGVSNSSYDVQCPFCANGRKEFKMNINPIKNSYRCVKCNASGGFLDLYSRLRTGAPLNRGETYKMLDMAKQELYGDIQLSPKKPEKRNYRVKEIHRASDENLNLAYSALLSLEAMRLTDSHKESLRKRGLTDEDMSRAEYRSFVDYSKLDLNSRYVSDLVKSIAIDDTYSNLVVSKPMFLKAGIAVGKLLTDKGISLVGVPGFYRLEGHWIFNFESFGIAIPTRNCKGEIVALQVRRDEAAKNGVRYMTVSSKNLPEGVTTGITRVHYSVFNDRLGDNTRVILTEGALKADVASRLMKNSIFVSILGVNNTADLDVELKRLKESGITEICNGFDMDRLLNIHVMDAAVRLNELCSNHGIKLKPIYWAEDDAKAVYGKLVELCEKHCVIPKHNESVFRSIALTTKALNSAEISIKDIQWPGTSKGIDDYLYSVIT